MSAATGSSLHRGKHSTSTVFTLLLFQYCISNVLDPASGSLIGTCPESTPQDAEQAIRAAAAALPAWRTRTGRDRSRILRKWYELVIQNKEDLATLITWENGKARPDAAGEVLDRKSVV